MARESGGHSEAMNEIGQRVRERRTHLGMSQQDLATEAGVSRDTVMAVEGGKGFRQRKLLDIEAALDRIEEETGVNAPPLTPEASEGLIEFDIVDDVGMHVVVKGSIRDAEALRAQVIATIREMRERDTPQG